MKPGSEPEFGCTYVQANSGSDPDFGAAVLPALVDDLLRAAVAGADHLAFGLSFGVDHVEGELVDAVLLDLGIDLRPQFGAGVSHRRRRGGPGKTQHHHSHDDSEHDDSFFSKVSAKDPWAALYSTKEKAAVKTATVELFRSRRA